jgi:hypothetical protein
MRASFRIRVDDPNRLRELEHLFARAGGLSLVDHEKMLVSLPFEQPCTREQAHEEVEFAVRTLLPAGSFRVEQT